MLKTLTSISHLFTLSYNTQVQQATKVLSKTYLRAMHAFFERLPVVPSSRASSCGSQLTSCTSVKPSSSAKDAIECAIEYEDAIECGCLLSTRLR